MYVYHPTKSRAIMASVYIKRFSGAFCPGGATGVTSSLRGREGGRSDRVTSAKEPCGDDSSLAVDAGTSVDDLDDVRFRLVRFLVDMAMLRFAGIYTLGDGCFSKCLA